PRAAAGEFPFDRPKLFSEVSASVAAVPPASLGLSSAPNPFRSHTVIRYMATTPGPVELAVYDAAGRLVRRMVSVDAIGAEDGNGVKRDGGKPDWVKRGGVRPGGVEGGGVECAFVWNGRTRTGLDVPTGV